MDIYTPNEIYSIINKLHNNGWEQTNYEDISWLREHKYFIEKEIDLNDQTIKWVNKPPIYSKLQTEFPNIVISNDGWIMDGQHRSSSARIRGDKTIKAFIGVK